MLTFKSSEETHNTCFKFIGADSAPKTTHLISNNDYAANYYFIFHS